MRETLPCSLISVHQFAWPSCFADSLTASSCVASPCDATAFSQNDTTRNDTTGNDTTENCESLHKPVAVQLRFRSPDTRWNCDDWQVYSTLLFGILYSTVLHTIILYYTMLYCSA